MMLIDSGGAGIARNHQRRVRSPCGQF